MFVVYSEFIGKDEVVPHLQEFLGYADTEEEFYEYLKSYKMPDYMVFDEPKPHLATGSLCFRVTNTHTSIYIIGEYIEHISKAKMAAIPPQQGSTL